MNTEKSRAENSKKSLHNADFTDADLKEADLSSGILIEACLKGADLTEADLCDSDVKEFIEDDPDNKGGTKNTDRGMELYADIEQELLRYFKIEL